MLSLLKFLGASEQPGKILIQETVRLDFSSCVAAFSQPPSQAESSNSHEKNHTFVVSDNILNFAVHDAFSDRHRYFTTGLLRVFSLRRIYLSISVLVSK